MPALTLYALPSAFTVVLVYSIKIPFSRVPNLLTYWTSECILTITITMVMVINLLPWLWLTQYDCDY